VIHESFDVTSWVSLRVEFSLKSDCGYPREAGFDFFGTVTSISFGSEIKYHFPRNLHLSI